MYINGTGYSANIRNHMLTVADSFVTLILNTVIKYSDVYLENNIMANFWPRN